MTKLKLVQITGDTDTLYGLDSDGEVWVRYAHSGSRWIKVNMKKTEDKEGV